MLTALVSLLLFGAVPSFSSDVVVSALPGIEVLKIAAPAGFRRSFELPPRLSASGMILYDLQSGEELMAKNPDQRRPMASLTKIMTALLVLENHRRLDDVLTVPPGADHIRGSTIGLKVGERFTVLALLKALLLPSANDAAYALAIREGGSVGAFVSSMNRRAATLGLKNTNFTNPAGLDSEQQYASVRDLGWLTMAALKHPGFREIVSTKTARISTGNGREFDLRNTNELLHENDHVFGVKTGTTNRAGECLIVLFEEQTHPYLLILLGSKDRYTDSLYVLQTVHDVVSE